MSLDDFTRTSMNGGMEKKAESAGVTAIPACLIRKLPPDRRDGTCHWFWRVLLLSSGITMFVSGCKHLPTPPPDTGTSSFVVVEPPPVAPRKGTVAEGSNGPIVEEHFVDAEPIPPLAIPIYPRQALAAKTGLVTIGVKISVDAEGRVAEVSPSMLTFSTPTRYSGEFDEAVRIAVMKWRFHPAQRYTLRIFRTEEGGGPPQELQRENTETYFDLSFTFTASGTVLSGSPAK